ncbi:MAG: C4-type zinc ribbon domain-containing protein [Bdellovibrionota bacterium]
MRKLEQVQEIDIQIGAILKKRAEHPKRLSQYDDQIKLHQTKIDEKKKIVDELERSKRQQLGALELNEDRIKRSQEKLEQIKTNQEYQALSKEIESLKKNSVVIKENADKVSADLEVHLKENATHTSALEEVQAKRNEESTKIAEEERILSTELNRLEGLRAEAVVGIDRRYLATYDRVRGGRGGIGIVSATGGNCKGCNMRIPPQIYNELQRGTELHACPSCKRILVYREGVAPTATAS